MGWREITLQASFLDQTINIYVSLGWKRAIVKFLSIQNIFVRGFSHTLIDKSKHSQTVAVEENTRIEGRQIKFKKVIYSLKIILSCLHSKLEWKCYKDSLNPYKFIMVFFITCFGQKLIIHLNKILEDEDFRKPCKSFVIIIIPLLLFLWLSRQQILSFLPSFLRKIVPKDEDSGGFSHVCIVSASLFGLVKAKIKTLIIMIQK